MIVKVKTVKFDRDFDMPGNRTGSSASVSNPQKYDIELDLETRLLCLKATVGEVAAPRYVPIEHVLWFEKLDQPAQVIVKMTGGTQTTGAAPNAPTVVNQHHPTKS